MYGRDVRHSGFPTCLLLYAYLQTPVSYVSEPKALSLRKFSHVEV
jgi:hypothetical protein